jgi:hypothetical protein
MYRIAKAIAAGLLVAALAAGTSALGRSTPNKASVDAKVAEQIAAHGRTTFWVVLRQQANLTPAHSMRPAPRGRYVYDTLTATADRTQQSLKPYLAEHHVPYKSFWILNAIRVTGGSTILQALAERPEVAKILPDVVFKISPEARGTREHTPNTVEWGVDRINAPQVWSTYNDRGENIVVGNVDTGVFYTHGALVAKYRGNLGGGNFNHNYNWWDPSAVCATGTPCDNNGHGTHTMGTMVGDDGNPGTNQIGVAPHATWIAAKGCETNSCSTSALLSSGQFMVAPTDLNGQNPQPNMRPDIVNNSWGNSNGGDAFYQATVQAWVASGIFPSFSSGNRGRAAEPLARQELRLRSTFDINNVIAGARAEAVSTWRIIKPNIAPGVNVRSS